MAEEYILLLSEALARREYRSLIADVNLELMERIDAPGGYKWHPYFLSQETTPRGHTEARLIPSIRNTPPLPPRQIQYWQVAGQYGTKVIYVHDLEGVIEPDVLRQVTDKYGLTLQE